MKKSLNQLYGSPLPLKVRPLPPIIPHNPLSWISWVYEYWFPRDSSSHKISCNGKLITSLSSCSSEEDALYVRVDDLKDIDRLWSMGFFGKGTLSRSEPSWYIRTARRLGLEGGDKLTSEDITAARREERKRFKLERAKAEAEELERRRKLDEGVDGKEEKEERENVLVDGKEEHKESLIEPLTEPLTEPLQSSSSPPSAPPIRPEDHAIIDSNNLLIQQEYLQLMPQEAFFLCYALGVLNISDPKTNKILSPEQVLRKFVLQNPNFISDYVVYHHYRSLGWCVRSGVKFGSELLLYKRGPPFSHAEFAIRILPSSSNDHEWWWNTSIGRVVGGVKKTLVFCYVQGDNHLHNEEITNGNLNFNIKQILESYKIREVVYRRWIATRNRD